MMMRFNAPPIIREYIEGAQNDNEEGCWPLGLETNSYHNTRNKAHKRYQQARKAPLTLDHETKEQENKQDTTGK
jgi:hypothetical protein